jgi:hypothetical protein
MAAERMHSPPGIARYCALITPRTRKDKNGQPTGDPKYQITLIYADAGELKAMKKAAMAVGIEKFGSKFPDLVKKGKANWPFGKNVDKEDDDGNRIPGFEDDDGEYVGFKTKDKPGVVDADAEPIMDKSEIYDGMTARVSCRPFSYDNESKGVAFYLINVQKLDDGNRLSGDPAAEDDFKPAKGKKSAAKKGKKDEDEDEDDLLN